MNEQEIFNLLLTLVAVAWFAKILSHFQYLKATHERLKNSNFISFFIEIENLFKVIAVIMPVFFSGTQSKNTEVAKVKHEVWIFTWLWWLAVMVSCWYL